MIKCNNQNNNNSRSGFTLIEMSAAVLLFVILLLAASGSLSDSQHSWNLMYNRTFSEAVTGGRIAKRAFEGIVRKSSINGLSIDTNGKWLEVHYYDDDASTFLDSYAYFYKSGTNLCIERGWLNPNNPSNPRGTLSTSIICKNVTNCTFKQSGKYVYMMLAVSTGSHSQVIGASAILHN